VDSSTVVQTPGFVGSWEMPDLIGVEGDAPVEELERVSKPAAVRSPRAWKR
jgi:hypothetical protein